MSYDISFNIPTGGEFPHEVATVNFTSNCHGMYSIAFRDKRGVKLLDGLKAKDALPLLAEAIAAFNSEPAYFRAMNPPNGWGDSLSAFVFLTRLREYAELHPATTISVSA